eukprot:jgi/Psemu1/314657/fgenesh1_kg.1638_\
MSESLVGSDVDDHDHVADLDCLMDSSLSEEEGSDDAASKDDEIDALLLNSFEHTEFPHTPLEIIEEGSKEENEEDTIGSGSGQFSIDRCPSSSMHGDSVHGESAESALFARLTATIATNTNAESGKPGAVATKNSIFSMIGLLRFVFCSMLLFQCGAMVNLWDEIAERVQAIEGGPQAIETAETIARNVKTRGTSLIASAKEIIDHQNHNLSELFDSKKILSSSMDNMFSDIELSASSWVDFAVDRLSKIGSTFDEEDWKSAVESWESAVEEVESWKSAAEEVEDWKLAAAEEEPVNQEESVTELMQEELKQELRTIEREQATATTTITIDTDTAVAEDDDLVESPSDEGKSEDTDTNASVAEDDDLVESPVESPTYEAKTEAAKSELELFHELVDELLRTPEVPFDEVDEEPVAEVVVPVTVAVKKSEWVLELEESIEGKDEGESDAGETA